MRVLRWRRSRVAPKRVTDQAHEPECPSSTRLGRRSLMIRDRNLSVQGRLCGLTFRIRNDDDDDGDDGSAEA